MTQKGPVLLIPNSNSNRANKLKPDHNANSRPNMSTACIYSLYLFYLSFEGTIFKT